MKDYWHILSSFLLSLSNENAGQFWSSGSVNDNEFCCFALNTHYTYCDTGLWSNSKLIFRLSGGRFCIFLSIGTRAPFYTIVQKRCCALGITFSFLLVFSEYQQPEKTTCLWCRTNPVCLSNNSCFIPLVWKP